MPLKSRPRIALLGNPNSGKSSLFNQLTGLNQHVGNFPGVTVDKKSGWCTINEHIEAEIIDLPGVYSLYPRSLDEKVVLDILSNPSSTDYPDQLVVVVDAANLKRNLLLFSQIHDLGLPVLLALNMVDVAQDQGLTIDATELAQKLDVRVVPINARTGEGIAELKFHLANPDVRVHQAFFTIAEENAELINKVKERYNSQNDYLAYQLLQQSENLSYLTASQKQHLHQLKMEYQFHGERLQRLETTQRYQQISERCGHMFGDSINSNPTTFSSKLDRVLTHRIGGYLIFLGVLFLIFQSIFKWATVPMDFIDQSVTAFASWLADLLPDGALVSLLTEGIIPGIGGILIFIPQIALLFGFVALLEESGYMARVVFLMDKIMRKFGLNGKSVVPLISGVACAIPAVMATRTIDNWKERMITIMVTPLMSCSARLPVYTILIAIAVPAENIWGIFNLQGLALLAMYLLGFLAVLFSAYLMKLLLKTKERSIFIMELPLYKTPRWLNVGSTIVEKVRTFVFEAGKVILAISIVLWVLASYGPGEKFNQAENFIQEENLANQYSEQEFDDRVAAFKLENSYAGLFGRTIEPVIKPLGFDWKIGIAIITSFAAREVFVGTMATIYSVGSGAEDIDTVKGKMQAEINPDTGEPMYSVALAFSLLVFYAFAMQCMSTVAVVYRETKSWTWPLVQTVYMTGLAYLSSLLVYSLLS